MCPFIGYWVLANPPPFRSRTRTRTRTIDSPGKGRGWELIPNTQYLTAFFLNSRKGQEDEEGDYAKGECEKEPHQRWAVLLSGEDDAENAGAEVAK